MTAATPIPTLTSAGDAAEVLAAGGLLGLPTETVYGLAADAHNLAAVRRVFQAKGRPIDHPLIVHLGGAEDLDEWARDVPAPLRELATANWPGPLTIVVPKQEWVPPEITGGLDTVAIRVPGQDVAREVITRLGRLTGTSGALVAPSANLFGQVSPTTAEHVRVGLAGRLLPGDAVLDAGPARVGLESTIVAWIDGRLRILRPGAVTIDGATSSRSGGPPPGIRAPGMLAAHYAPSARVIVVDDAGLGDLASRIGQSAPLAGRSVALLAPAGIATPAGWRRLGSPVDDAAYAEMLYASMRAADDAGAAAFVAVLPQSGPLRAAIADRLSRAAAGSAGSPDPGRQR